MQVFKQVDASLNAIVAIMNAVDAHYCDSETRYDLGLSSVEQDHSRGESELRPEYFGELVVACRDGRKCLSL